jgi:cytidine deaminase
MMSGPDSAPRPVDHELIAATKALAARCYDQKNHHIAAGARAPDGRIVSGMSVSHFLGGPCAEIVVIGTAATQQIYEISTMVIFGLGGRILVPPCGRCRQALFDYYPAIDIVLGDPPENVPITHLLPRPYRRWLTDPLRIGSMGGNQPGYEEG